MNKQNKIFLSILGGFDVVFYMFSPIMLSAIWTTFFGYENWTSYLILIVALLSSMFRAIKVGWLKE